MPGGNGRVRRLSACSEAMGVSEGYPRARKPHGRAWRLAACSENGGGEQHQSPGGTVASNNQPLDKINLQHAQDNCRGIRLLPTSNTRSTNSKTVSHWKVAVRYQSHKSYQIVLTTACATRSTPKTSQSTTCAGFERPATGGCTKCRFSYEIGTFQNDP